MEAEAPRRGLPKRILAELRNILPAWIFLLLSFALLRLTLVAVLREHGVETLPPSRVLVGSLLVAKALVTVDTLRLFPKLEERPVLFAALLRTSLYGALVFVFQFADALLEFRRDGLGRGAGEFAERCGSLRFWVLQIWLLVLLLEFSVARTFARRMGRAEFRRLLIGR